ncbi:ABC-three component system middle component 7 [Cyclobacterium xiamenense]|uniref:ABC-three component system middle component 7 n=1 Tax=Cyclobacterium xiamenense TaxID=1297121 RepID=UPI0035CF0621
MIYPNKHIRIKDSIIYKMLSILEVQSDSYMNIHELYSKTKNKFNNADEFILSLDVLYALDMIEVDFKTETIKYAKRN